MSWPRGPASRLRSDPFGRKVHHEPTDFQHVYRSLAFARRPLGRLLFPLAERCAPARHPGDAVRRADSVLGLFVPRRNLIRGADHARPIRGSRPARPVRSNRRGEVFGRCQDEEPGALRLPASGLGRRRSTRLNGMQRVGRGNKIRGACRRNKLCG